MSIAAVCPNCRANYNLPDNLFGRKIRCTRCQGSFVAGAIPQTPATRRLSKVRPTAPVALPVRRESGSSRSKSSGIAPAIIGGSIVAGVFAAVLVAGIYFVLGSKNNTPGPTVVMVENRTTTVREVPMANTAPNQTLPTEKAPPQPIAKDPPVENPGTGDGSLTPQVRERVKRATVYLRVTLQNNSAAQGSGFFAVEPGIVLTNAHVLGMLVGQTRKPQKVEVVLNSGQPDERTLPGQILEVDRVSDLAVLRVTGNNLPEPLSVQSSKDLQETQQVYVCGFPLGVNLGKEISIRKSSVASLRKENGEITRVQLEGGMDPGNSGGPIIDTKGNVVGVAVAGIRGTTINFAIPGEKVHSILNGRVSKVTFGQPYKSGDKTSLPVTVVLTNPLGKIKQAGIEVWTGAPGAPRPPSATQPAPVAKDSPRRQLLLAPRDGICGGEIELPPLPAGMAYWFQPIVAGDAARMQWSAAHVYPNTAPPLERRPATLALTHRPGNSNPVEIELTTKFRVERNGSEQELNIDLDGQFREATQSVDNQGIATVRLEYLKVDVGVTVDGRNPPNPTPMQQAAQFVATMAGDLRLDRQGSMVQNRLDMSKAPMGSRAGLGRIGQQVQQSLDALAVPLPGNEVKPGQSWTAQRMIPLDVGRPDAGVMDMKYTYLGVRTRDARLEAVLSLDGAIRARDGNNQYIKGKTSGTAIIDVTTGLTVQAVSSIEVDLDMTIEGQASRADGAMEIQVQRTVPAK
ncbi:MAG: trypsin-like peptidase domain-containing protein [Planctomycetia bacterium]|nr:trypsin-like peptidase domain-containing protein [Planctomycetia bacterium]